MRIRTKIVLFLLYIFIEFYFFIAGAMKDSDILIVLGLLLFLAGIILIITVITAGRKAEDHDKCNNNNQASQDVSD